MSLKINVSIYFRSNTQSRPNLSDSTTDLRQKPPRRSSSFDDILNGTLIEIKQQQPLYYTVDRRGRQNLSTFASGARDSSRPTRRPSSAVPRSNRRDSDYQVRTVRKGIEGKLITTYFYFN